jgi:hypothetical protein
MNTPILQKNFTAEAAIAAYRIVKPGTADGQVVQAAAVGDALIGVANEVGAAITERQDVVVAGVAYVEYGGAVTRGDWLTSDSVGRALAAAPSAGTNNNVIGRALLSGVSGDIGSVLIAPGRIQG